jgi:exopolysaccharide biosynthesis polyprenyl glycosylphosphotransferase
MLKKRAKRFSIYQRLLDLTAVAVSWLLAYFIRFRLIPGAQEGLFQDFAKLTPYIMVISLFFFTRNNLYHSTRYFSWYKEVFGVVKSNVQSISAFFILLYIITQVRFSRITLLIYPVIAILISVLLRMIIRSQLRKIRKSGKNLRHIIVIGSGRKLQEYIKTLNFRPQTGLRVLGWIDSNGLAKQYSIKELSIEDLKTMDNNIPDMAIIGYDSQNTNEINQTINAFNQLFVPVLLIPNIEYDYLGFDIEVFEGIPLIAINSPKMNMTGELMKRAADIIGSVFGLIILSPVFLIISILIKLTSRGPVFYGQERMSVDGIKFKMWKFRSMKTDAEQKSGAVWAVENDDRKTPIGAFLRKTSLDEIPQFWNVLLGNMSLVGPRPERPVFIEKFKDQIPSYMLRHRAKAGITGWAQINGWRGNTSIEKRIEFDLYYIKHWSLWFDVRILLLTFVKGFINKNAY